MSPCTATAVVFELKEPALVGAFAEAGRGLSASKLNAPPAAGSAAPASPAAPPSASSRSGLADSFARWGRAVPRPLWWMPNASDAAPSGPARVFDSSRLVRLVLYAIASPSAAWPLAPSALSERSSSVRLGHL